MSVYFCLFNKTTEQSKTQYLRGFYRVLSLSVYAFKTRIFADS